MSLRQLDQLKIIELNINSIISHQKRHYLQSFIKSHQPDIMLLCETRLRVNHVVHLKNYSISRNDRCDAGNVGTAVIIRDNIKHDLINTAQWQLTSLECTAILVHTSRDKLCIVSCYRSITRNTPISNDIETIVSKCNQQNWTLIMGGDFNAKHPDWNNTSTCTHGRHIARWFTQFGMHNNLHIECPSDPTFQRTTQTPSIIDFFIVSTHVDVQYHASNPSHLQVIDYDSDHRAVQLIVNLNSRIQQKQRRTCFNYNDVNWLSFKLSLNTNVNSVLIPASRNLTPDEIDTKLEEMNTAIKDTMCNVIPTISVNRDTLIILPADVQQLIDQKKKMRRRWQRTRLHPDGNLLKTQIRLLSQIIDERVKQCYDEHWTNTLSSIRMGPTVFKKIKSICKINASKSPSAMFNPSTNIQVSHPDDIANVLGESFRKVHTQNNGLGDAAFSDLVNTDVERNYNNHIPRVLFTLEESANSSTFCRSRHLLSVSSLKSILKSRANKRSTGHDGIPNVVLRKLTHSCIVKIATLFNHMYNVSHFPAAWKTANIIPISKPAKPADHPSSYRPISLLPCLSKIYERALKYIIDTHCEDHNILPDDQFGFRSDRSTRHPLVILRTHITHALNQKSATIACATDIEKAFDTVWREGLIYKMRHIFAFDHHICRCIYHLLLDRTFSVKLSDALSSRFDIAAGVPQGGVLSAILYVIYIADLPPPPDHHQPIRRLQYADDMILYVSVKNLIEGERRLNEYISEIIAYLSKWKIKINPEKCESIVFKGPNKRFCTSINRQHNHVAININGTALLPQRSIKYLGVWFSKNLSNIRHVTHITKKVNSAYHGLRNILQRTHGLDPRIKVLCYKQLIRPIMLYGFSCWSSLTSHQMERLRKLERVCLRSCTRSRQRNHFKYINNSELYKKTGIERIDRVLVKQTVKFFDKPHENCELFKDCLMVDNDYEARYDYTPPWHIMHLNNTNELFVDDMLMLYHRRFNTTTQAVGPVYNTNQ